MDLEHLYEFAVLAESKNFSEAAEKLFISQSALSKHIKSLEQELGVPLFNRENRSATLNEYGQLLLPHALKISEIRYACLTDFHNKLNNINGAINICFEYPIFNLLASFEKENPNITIHVRHVPPHEMVEQLRSGKCELAFLYEKEEQKNLTSVFYRQDSLVAVLPNSHPLANQTSISLEQLKGENFIMLSQRAKEYAIAIEACQKAGFEPKIALSGCIGRDVVRFVKEEVGVSIMIKSFALQHQLDGVKFVDIISSTPVPCLYIYYRKNVQLSPCAKHLLDYINAKTIQNELIK